MDKLTGAENFRNANSKLKKRDAATTRMTAKRSHYRSQTGCHNPVTEYGWIAGIWHAQLSAIRQSDLKDGHPKYLAGVNPNWGHRVRIKKMNECGTVE